MASLPPPPPRLELALPTNKSLPTCSPNLMPFHIVYSGSAPVSTYFRVKDAPPPSYLGDAAKKLNALTITKQETVVVETTRTSTPSDEDSQVVTRALSTAPSVSESQQTLVTTSSATTAFSSRTDVSSVTLAVDEEGDTQMDTIEDNSTNAVAPSTDAGRHYTAAFRGRTVRGLRVALPEGYTGVILEAPDAGKVDAKGKGRAMDVEERSTGRAKARGRTKSGRKGKRGAEEEEPHDADEGRDLDASPSSEAGLEETGPVRTLQATSTFSSFVLWNPDIPVNESRDEYVRALKEWAGLASVIHSYDE